MLLSTARAFLLPAVVIVTEWHSHCRVPAAAISKLQPLALVGTHPL